VRNGGEPSHDYELKAFFSEASQQCREVLHRSSALPVPIAARA
jgi:hypothetical protein